MFKLARLAIACAAAFAAAPAFAQEGPYGIWIDHTGRGAVEISPCNGKVCGRIVWLQDKKNAQVCGMQVIGNVKATSAGKWGGGWIYDPDEEERYSVTLTLLNPDTLRVTGSAAFGLASESFTWKRATTELKRCNA